MNDIFGLEISARCLNRAPDEYLANFLTLLLYRRPAFCAYDSSHTTAENQLAVSRIDYSFGVLLCNVPPD